MIPHIPPLAAEATRPLFSVMIPTYNRTRFLRETLESVLAQDLGPAQMQIEVVDNCSPTRESEELVSTVGAGRITYFRQPQNIGIVGNWNTCIERARGMWVHILHDDDLVLPGFYATNRRAFTTYPKVVAVFGYSNLIDREGEVTRIFRPPNSTHGAEPYLLTDGLFQACTGSVPVATPSAVVRRTAYEAVGGFAADYVATPDWEMWIRLAAYGPIAQIDEPLTQYRMHPGNDTNSHVRSGVAVRDAWRAMQTGICKLPPEQQARANALARQYVLGTALINHHRLHAIGDYRSALINSRMAWRIAPLNRAAVRAVLRDLYRLAQRPAAS